MSLSSNHATSAHWCKKKIFTQSTVKWDLLDADIRKVRKKEKPQHSRQRAIMIIVLFRLPKPSNPLVRVVKGIEWKKTLKPLELQLLGCVVVFRTNICKCHNLAPSSFDGASDQQQHCLPVAASFPTCSSYFCRVHHAACLAS